MFAKSLIIALLATVVAAQCEPSSTSTTPPTATAHAIHPNGNNNKCLDIAGANIADGTEVRVHDCNGTPAQQWIINKGTGAIQVAANKNFCLDAGTSLTNGAKVKIWTCYAGLPQQQWTYGSDNHLVVGGQNECLDLTNGDLGGANGSPQSQIWQCAGGNKNQVWTINANGKRRRHRWDRN